MGAVTGLLLSGALTSTIGWQWIFFLSAIMSAILFVLGVFAIPDTPGLHGVSPKIDIGGSITATAGLLFISFLISSSAPLDLIFFFADRFITPIPLSF